ncbi:MAG: zinc ribbon domain-containing protein [Clostridia bacterium]|nr:zinc ribbon domain-containing protein [Clostridia bacterium]
MTCPSCGASLPAGTKFCSGCGCKIEAAPAAQTQSIFCTGCGTQLPAGTKFCNSCGQRLDG